MFKKILLSALMPMMIVTSSCSAEESEKNFNWEYFSTLNKDENIFYSPYSIKSALSLTANGAEGQTQEEILKLISEKSIDDVNKKTEEMQKIIFENYNSESRKLQETNLISINKKYAANGINEEYKNTAEKIYKSEVRTADFENNLEGEKKYITKFVKEKTNDFINDYKSTIKAETVTDILNVIYFKGDWENQFKAENTAVEKFTNKNETKIDVKMMNQTFRNKIRYYEDEKYKSIELPYKKENGLSIVSMYLIMPKKNNDLEIAEEWNEEATEYKENFLEQIKNAPTFHGKVFVKVPKFEMDVENKIEENLQKIGIRRAFTDDAEFLKIINNKALKITDVKHRAKIKTDEKGTEAAAITEIGMMVTGAAPIPEMIKDFYADRPFLFVIKDVQSNEDLFVGVVNNL